MLENQRITLDRVVLIFVSVATGLVNYVGHDPSIVAFVGGITYLGALLSRVADALGRQHDLWLKAKYPDIKQ